jgi:hypothetical protein
VTLTCSDFLKQLKTEIPAKISDDNLLNGAINSAVTSVVFDDITELSDLAWNASAAEPDYIVTIQIDSEKMNVTAVDTDTHGHGPTGPVGNGCGVSCRQLGMGGGGRVRDRADCPHEDAGRKKPDRDRDRTAETWRHRHG